MWGGSSFAETYTVNSGDVLSKIAERELGSWRKYVDIAGLNDIKAPYVIYPKQKLKMPEMGKVVEIKKIAKKIQVALGTRNNPVSYTDNKVGADPWVGTTKEALCLLGINVPEGVEIRFVDEGIDKLNPSEIFIMVSGKGTMKWYKNGLSEGKSKIQKIGIFVQGKKVVSIWQKPECENWLRRFDKPIEKPVVDVSVPAEKPSWYSGGVIPEKKAKEIVYIPPREEKYVIEHEPIVGAWAWQNKLARGWGGYGEYLAWLRKGQDYQFQNGWSPGIGLYGLYSEGESRTNTYDWIEKGFGPQVGLKYIATDWQWQGKVRLIWENMSGGNNEGYHMTQDNLKLGGYTEFIQRESEDFYWGLVGEAWYALNKERTSTWVGDSPSRRGQLAVSAFGQWKLNENWQFRAIGGIFHQTWDHLTGIRLQPEFRWNETIMFGPWLSFYLFGISNVYDGIASAGDLMTYGGCVRSELGKPIRDYYAYERMESIKADDQKWFEGLTM